MKVEMDGQCKCGFEREGTVGGGDAKPDGVEATSCEKLTVNSM